MFDFDALEDGELRMCENDLILFLRKSKDDGWLIGVHHIRASLRHTQSLHRHQPTHTPDWRVPGHLH